MPTDEVTAPPARGSMVETGHRALTRLSVLVAVVCLVADSIGFVLQGPGLTAPVHLGLLLMIIAVDGALALPARYSGWVALVHAVSIITLAAVLGGGPGVETDLAGMLIAGYRAGAWLRGWPSAGSLVALIGGIIVARWISGQADWPVIAAEAVKSALLPWLVGTYTTARRAYIDELRHRRENERRDAEADVARAVARERTAIAWDLHDVISHHVSAIGVHAGAARMKLAAARGTDEDGVGGSLAAVETSSRAAMVDLRMLLDVLHGTADSASQPGLDNLEELFEGVRRSGLATRLGVRGVPRPVPDSLDIALYRIVQEMLTNALRHGDGSTVDIEIDYGADTVTLTARNRVPSVLVPAGRPSADTPHGGRGLAGIRTRAAMFHGTVTHGPDQDHRYWETIVTVPTETEPMKTVPMKDVS